MEENEHYRVAGGSVGFMGFGIKLECKHCGREYNEESRHECYMKHLHRKLKAKRDKRNLIHRLKHLPCHEIKIQKNSLGGSFLLR